MSRHHRKNKCGIMNRHEFLYWLEHIHLPEAFFELKAEFVDAITSNEDAFQEIMCSIASDMKAKVDFTDDDFMIKGFRLEDGEYAVVLYFPYPQEPAECFFSVCRFDEEYTKMRYITAELGEEDDVFVCEWIDGEHYNYGICELEDSLETCVKLPPLKEDENAFGLNIVGESK